MDLQARDAQAEFDRLSAAVKQIESYNTEMRDQLQVAQREAEATESASRQTGKEKNEQDYLIVDLQQSLKRRQEENETLKSQLEAQISERRAADVKPFVLRTLSIRTNFSGSVGGGAKRYGQCALRKEAVSGAVEVESRPSAAKR